LLSVGINYYYGPTYFMGKLLWQFFLQNARLHGNFVVYYMSCSDEKHFITLTVHSVFALSEVFTVKNVTNSHFSDNWQR